MTALCSGGTSSAQTGFGTAVAVGVAQIAATLNNVPTTLAVLAAGYIGAVGYELSTFCSTDPPAMPTITAGDWAALVTVSDPVAHLAAQQKFQDMLANYFWPLFCKCDTTTTPAQPALPTPPSNIPTAQPPQVPIAPSVQPCWDAKAISEVAGGFPVFDWSQLLWDDNSTATAPTSNDRVYTAQNKPAQVSMTVKCDNATGSNPITAVSITVLEFDTGGTLQHTYATGVGATETLTFSPALTAGTLNFSVNFTYANHSAAPTGSCSGEVTMWCPGQPVGLPQSPCCPPDPSVQAMLQTILALVTSIYQSEPTPITSYADGTAHAGLSGDGTITLVDSALAIRVNITTDPTYLGLSVGSPNYLFDRGFIVPVINSSPVHGVDRLVFNPQFFALPELTEQIGYSLSPGVVVTITELTAGP